MSAKQLVILLLLTVACKADGQHKTPPSRNGTCNDVGRSTLDLCLGDTDDATCEGVYREAFESCQIEVAMGRDVCVWNWRNDCTAVVAAEKTLEKE
jgi:hypothetical protein